MAAAPDSRHRVVWFCQACKRALEVQGIPEDVSTAEPADFLGVSSPHSGLSGDSRQVCAPV